MTDVFVWGLIAGIIHFVALGLMYGNPVVGRRYVAAERDSAAVRSWPSRSRYLVTQFLGTQIEVYLVTIGFVWLYGLLPTRGLTGAVLLGALFSALRVYPRFWNMWIQSTYPRNLLATEMICGVVGSYVMVLTLYCLAR